MFDHFFGWLAPVRCAACDCALIRRAIFCATCHDTLLPHSGEFAELASSKIESTRISASFCYGGAAATVIQKVKYGGRLDLLDVLGRMILEGLPDLPDHPLLVAPIPSHNSRVRQRGFDLPCLLAKSVSKQLGLKLQLELLRRVRTTKHLAGLGHKDRSTEIHGAFALNGSVKQQALVLLVDDVFTTGATSAAARRLLEEQGTPTWLHVLACTARS